jgi:hypothetical protein
MHCVGLARSTGNLVVLCGRGECGVYKSHLASQTCKRSRAGGVTTCTIMALGGALDKDPLCFSKDFGLHFVGGGHGSGAWSL